MRSSLKILVINLNDYSYNELILTSAEKILNFERSLFNVLVTNTGSVWCFLYESSTMNTILSYSFLSENTTKCLELILNGTVSLNSILVFNNDLYAARTVIKNLSLNDYEYSIVKYIGSEGSEISTVEITSKLPFSGSFLNISDDGKYFLIINKNNSIFNTENKNYFLTYDSVKDEIIYFMSDALPDKISTSFSINNFKFSIGNTLYEMNLDKKSYGIILKLNKVIKNISGNTIETMSEIVDGSRTYDFYSYEIGTDFKISYLYKQDKFDQIAQKEIELA